jgi:hypothetical protein
MHKESCFIQYCEIDWFHSMNLVDNSSKAISQHSQNASLK